MMADLTHIGDQSGCLLMMSAAIPAMCGVAIEVPDSLSYSRLLWFFGETAAITFTPGAMMSGFKRSPPLDRAGPRLEKPATAGASTLVSVPALSDAVAPAPADAAYALTAVPVGVSTAAVGTEWKSASSEFGDGLYMIMPTPPAWKTAL